MTVQQFRGAVGGVRTFDKDRSKFVLLEALGDHLPNPSIGLSMGDRIRCQVTEEYELLIVGIVGDQEGG